MKRYVIVLTLLLGVAGYAQRGRPAGEPARRRQVRPPAAAAAA